VQRSEFKRSENVANCRPKQWLASRQPGRSACTTCTGAAQSTAARRTVDRHDRPTGIPNSPLGSVDRPVGRKDGSVDCPVSRHANLPVLLRFGLCFWKGVESNCSFLKLWDSRAINKRVETHELYPSKKPVLIVESIKSISPLPRGRRLIAEPR